MSRLSAPGTDPGAPLVLALDTAGSASSVALGRGDALLGHERREMRHSHAEALLPMIDRVVEAAALSPAAIEVVAVSVGPGGFTGIRAGLAAAHGLALALDARLVGVTSFAAVAALVPSGATRLLVALDSRRADFYAQLFNTAGAACSEPAAMPPEELAAWLGGTELRVAGDAAQEAAAVLPACAEMEIVPNSAPDAIGVLAAIRRWPDLADPAARPLYLRAPDVSFPKARAG
jgi:tRNA threonylcarbamoyladenosine biosynthesis protein TsaB